MEAFLRLFKAFSALSVLLCVILSSCDEYIDAISQVPMPIVILDAGHGGEDGGEHILCLRWKEERRHRS